MSNNPYQGGDPAGAGRRERLNSGALGILALTADNAGQAARLLRGTRGTRGRRGGLTTPSPA
ncbi:hypothetical protein [Actinomadura sp. 3N508]|uniref:hypothetical protein n=1 Tax=Actinomadura sp. 3N508 TaxID=3375153 RepID=UPI00378FB192